MAIVTSDYSYISERDKRERLTRLIEKERETIIPLGAINVVGKAGKGRFEP